MKNFAARLKKSNSIMQIIMTFGRMGLGESSVETVELMREIIENRFNYLRLWARKFENLFVNEVRDIPNPESVCITYLSGITNKIDACNQTCKSCRLLKKYVMDTQSEYQRKITLYVIIQII